MDDCPRAFHFAEDLLKFAFGSQLFPWEKPEIPFYYKGESPFHDDIGDAVIGIVNSNSKEIFGCHKDLTNMGATTAIIFSRYALEAAPIYFPEGYSPERMLCYCAMIIGVGLMMYESPSNGIAECTSEVIGTVLISHILTGEFKKQGGYERLTEVSEHILRYLENKVKTKSS